jgi:dimethylargininase
MASTTATLHVITRDVSPTIARCELTCIDREPIDARRVEAQHHAYVALFRQAEDLYRGTRSDASAGAVVVTADALEALPDFPDSMFVEDVALMFDEFAILTRPGAASRRGEVAHIAAAVRRQRPDSTYTIEEPGTVDGGDVLVVGRHIFVGQSTRTNAEGFTQLRKMGEAHGYLCEAVTVKGCLHLKSAASMLDASTVLACPELVDFATFTAAGLKVVPVAAPGSPNVLSFELGRGGHSMRFIVVPRGDALCEAAVRAWAPTSTARVEVLSVEADEIAKAEGALTCCSLLSYRHAAASGEAA